MSSKDKATEKRVIDMGNSMDDYVIITDAAADIPYDIVEKGFGVTVIPIKIKMKGDTFEHFPDFRNMSSTDFYPMIRMGALPSTIPISRETYMEVFEEKLKAGKDIIYIGIAGGLSDSLQTAADVSEELKAKYPSQRISIIDSKNASTGLGLLVIEAIRLKESTVSYDEAVNILQEKRDKVRNYFFVDDICHLKRSGKIARTEQSAAAALKIRTVFKVDTSGKLAITTKVRGNPNALDYLSKKVCEEADPESVINIASAAGKDRVDKLKELLIEKLSSEAAADDSGTAHVVSISDRIDQKLEFLDIRTDGSIDSVSDSVEQRLKVSDMSLIGGTHSGPGTVAVAFYAR